MTHEPSTTLWSTRSAEDSRITSRFSVTVPGAAGRVAGLETTILHADGSGELLLELPSGVKRIEIASGESFASVMDRRAATLAQASYPTSDTPAGPDALPTQE